ncbi:MAG: hypothetical protein P8Y70_11210 [Candidatus Lokiarchaeota archaeon]
MSAMGLVFLFDMQEGSPEDISAKFSEYFPGVSENLVREELLELVELKEIMYSKRIFCGGIKKDFKRIVKNPDMIGDLAWKVFKKHTDIEASEDVRVLIYKGSEVPWEFTLLACVLYD